MNSVSEDKVQMVAKVPECDPGRLAYFGDGTMAGQIFRYSHDKHTEHDILRPGYFNTARDNGLRKGDEIHYTVMPNEKPSGGVGPCDLLRGILVVDEMPGMRGAAADQDAMVGIVTRYGNATPVRHGGTAAKSKAKAA